MARRYLGFVHFGFVHLSLVHLGFVLAAMLMALAVMPDANAQTQTQTDAASAPAAGEKSAVPAPSLGTPAETLFPSALQDAVSQQQLELDRLAKSAARQRRDDNALETIRLEVEAVQANTRQTEMQLQPLLSAVNRQSSALGAPPKKGEPDETAQISAERSRLGEITRRLEGAIKQTGLTQERASQLLGRLHNFRLENLGRDLRRRYGSITSALQWQQFVADLPRFGHQIATVAEIWWAGAHARLHWLALIVLGAIGLSRYLRGLATGRIQRWTQPALEASPPAYLQRVRMALVASPLLLGPGLLVAGAVYIALDVAGLLNGQVTILAFSALKAIALFLLTNALARGILLPSVPAWRLIGVPTATARRYLWLTRLLAGVYCFDVWANDVFTALHVPLSVSIIETLFANLAFAGLLFTFAWAPTQSPADTDNDRFSARLLTTALGWARVPASLAVATIVGASLLGYLPFGRFIAGQVMLLGISAAVLLLGHLAAHAIANDEIFAGPGDDGATQPGRIAPTSQRRRWLLGALSFALNLVLIILVAGVLLWSWGYSNAEMAGWGKSLLFGFEVGEFRFSLIQIILAIALFVAIVMATRLFQSWLSSKVLSGDNVDRGIANSIHAGVGYTGIALAGLVGVSYAGLDLSNIALIASALSIGIGFGLNAIASNFVSGVIMLIERPIKVGDWVVVGAHEGYVRHISVRATEIETFDRASVIIPNADFMTGAVQNWTHRNAMGRVIVRVGASYGADPHHVMDVLSRVAAECDGLLKYPSTSVHFEDFGASSLDFSLRGYINDVSKTLSTRTALRLAIAEAFQKEGIEIPFPQQDVHLRDLDGVRQYISQAVANRQGETITPQARSPRPSQGDDEPPDDE